MLRTTLLCLMLTLTVEAYSQQLLEKLSFRLAVPTTKCRAKIKTSESPETKMMRFRKFWSSEFEFDMWADGCLGECVLMKMQLLDRHGNLRLTNAIALLRDCGADDEETRGMIEMVTTGCVMSELMPQLPRVDQAEECVQPLLMAICFRNGIFQDMEQQYAHSLDVNTTLTVKLYV